MTEKKQIRSAHQYSIWLLLDDYILGVFKTFLKLQKAEMWSFHDVVFTQYSLQKPVSTEFKYVDAMPFVLFCSVMVSIANIQKLQSWQTGSEHFLYSLLSEEGDPKPL